MFGPKLTRLECDDRLTCFSCGWWWSKMSRFLDTGRKSLGFSVSIEMDLVFGWMVDIDWTLVRRIELDLISVSASEMICFVYGGRK